MQRDAILLKANKSQGVARVEAEEATTITNQNSKEDWGQSTKVNESQRKSTRVNGSQHDQM